MMQPHGRLGALVAMLLLLLSCSAGARPVHRNKVAALHKQHARPSAHTANGPKRQLSQAVVEDSVDPFAAAPSCRRLPTASNATADASGRLWGMLNNASCAFKDVAGHVLFYVDYTPGEWLSTPACQAPPFPDNSVADSRFKVWGWTDPGALCAFKDDQQQPIPIQKRYNRLSWDEAPVCITEPVPTPRNSRPDNVGCLWGYQLDRNCVFKDEDKPAYYEGYNQFCNTTASKLHAAEFNANQDEFINASGDDVLPLPGTNAPLPVPGQKHIQEEYKDEKIDDLFNNPGKAPTTMPSNQTAPAAFPDPAVPVVPAAQGVPSTRRLAQTDNSKVIDPRFPKQSLATASTASYARGWKDGGPGGATPPRHGSRSVTKRTPLLPESNLPTTITAAEGDNVYHPADANVTGPSALDCGLGGITMPGSAAKMGVSCVPAGTSDGGDIKISEADSVDTSIQVDPAVGRVGPGHLSDPNNNPVESRRRLTGFAPVTAAAIAYSTGGEASSFASSTSTSLSHGGSSAASTAVSHSAGNGTATAVSKANATDGGSAVAQSAVNAKDGQKATLVVDAQLQGVNKSCVVIMSKGKLIWSCNGNTGNGSTPPAAADTGSAGTTGSTSTGNPTAGTTPGGTNSTGTGSAGTTGNPTTGTVPAGTNSTDTGSAGTTGTASTGLHNSSIAAPSSNTPPSNDTAPVNVSPVTADISSEPASYDVLAPSWQEAVVCRLQPNKTNSVQDAMGRLWGYNAVLQRTCAYRNLDGTSMDYPGYIQVKWETAPACVDGPTSANSMADVQGRLWGWLSDQQENCAFKNPSSGVPVYYPGYRPVPVTQGSQPGGTAMLPSAAGPVNASAVPAGGNFTAAESDRPSDEAALTQEAMKQVQQMQAALPPNATLAERSNVAARAALTIMVASDALHAAQNEAPSGVIKAAEGDSLQPAANAQPAAARWFGILRATMLSPAAS